MSKTNKQKLDKKPTKKKKKTQTNKQKIPKPKHKILKKTKKTEKDKKPKSFL